jgi:hypothetical protein
MVLSFVGVALDDGGTPAHGQDQASACRLGTSARVPDGTLPLTITVRNLVGVNPQDGMSLYPPGMTIGMI